MSIYAILLNEPNEAAWEKVREKWAAHHVLDDRLAFVSAENAMTADVARDVGIGSGGALGIVVQMDFYAGHTTGDFIEWLSKHRD